MGSSASLDAASVSDVVTKTVALSSDTQASCVTTTRRLQSSGTTTGTLAGTIDCTCSSFSTATDYITQTLTNIAGATSVSVSTTGGYTTTTSTTTDGGGWPWWAWFLLMLFLVCFLALLVAHLLAWVHFGSSERRKKVQLRATPLRVMPVTSGARPTMVRAKPATSMTRVSAEMPSVWPASITHGAPPTAWMTMTAGA